MSGPATGAADIASRVCSAQAENLAGTEAEHGMQFVEQESMRLENTLGFLCDV
jgi:hypothetical protein